jgi:hypothetical protein
MHVARGQVARVFAGVVAESATIGRTLSVSS